MSTRDRSIVIKLTDLLKPIGAYLLEQPVGTLSSGRGAAGQQAPTDQTNR
jgi:hypothetical protein